MPAHRPMVINSTTAATVIHYIDRMTEKRKRKQSLSPESSLICTPKRSKISSYSLLFKLEGVRFGKAGNTKHAAPKTATIVRAAKRDAMTFTKNLIQWLNVRAMMMMMYHLSN